MQFLDTLLQFQSLDTISRHSPQDHLVLFSDTRWHRGCSAWR